MPFPYVFYAGQQMNFTLDKERKEAQRKAIEAQGIQDFQNIVTKGITEQQILVRPLLA